MRGKIERGGGPLGESRLTHVACGSDCIRWKGRKHTQKQHLIMLNVANLHGQMIKFLPVWGFFVSSCFQQMIFKEVETK